MQCARVSPHVALLSSPDTEVGAVLSVNRMEKSLATLKMDAFFEHTPKLQISVSEFDITNCLNFCEKTWL